MARKVFQDLRGLRMKEWLWYLILLLTICVPLSQYLSMRILGLGLLVSLTSFSLSRFVEKAWDIIIYLVVISVGLAYSDDYVFGLSILETRLSLILVPVIFSTQPNFGVDRLNKVLFVFLCSVCFGSCLCLIGAFLEFLNSGSFSAFVYYDLTRHLGFQPTYYAYFLVFSITSGLYLLNYEKAPVRPLTMSILVLFLFLVLMLTGGRTTFISMLLVCSFFVLKFLLESRGTSQRTTFGLVLVIIVGLFATSVLVGDSAIFSDSWDRFGLWRSALDANSNMLFGVGTGDYKTVLNQYFLSHGLQQYASENLNAHNQFIQTYLANGILGSLSVLLLIAKPLYQGFRQDNALTILVLFPFLIYGMTEVFLGRYQGVVFFALLHQVSISHLKELTKPTYNADRI